MYQHQEESIPISADTTETMQKIFKNPMKASPAGEKVQLALILVCTSRISGMLPNMVLISSCARIGPPSCPSFSNGTWNNWGIKKKKKKKLMPSLYSVRNSYESNSVFLLDHNFLQSQSWDVSIQQEWVLESGLKIQTLSLIHLYSITPFHLFLLTHSLAHSLSR